MIYGIKYTKSYTYNTRNCFRLQTQDCLIKFQVLQGNDKLPLKAIISCILRSVMHEPVRLSSAILLLPRSTFASDRAPVLYNIFNEYLLCKSLIVCHKSTVTNT